MAEEKARKVRSWGWHLGLVLGVVALIVALIAAVDLRPDLSHVDISVLSGSVEGRYFATVEDLSEGAASKSGRLENVSTKGSADNLARLAASQEGCAHQFALVQDGMPGIEGASIELVGRLPQRESVLLLGRSADEIGGLSDLEGKTVGVGPVGSGTAAVGAGLFGAPDLARLGVKLVHMPIGEQMSGLASGQGPDLGLFVIAHDAPLVRGALVDQGLQMVDFEEVEALAARLPFAKADRIPGGFYDLTRRLPPEDKRVLSIGTLVVGNGCASPSTTIGLMTLLSRTFPDFIRHNRQTPNETGLPLADETQDFYDNQGADLVARHVPWVLDVMPHSNWATLILLVSLLFNLMTVLHRFSLTRIDAKRARIDKRVEGLFGEALTLVEIGALGPEASHREAAFVKKLDALIVEIKAMIEQVQRSARAIIVPMGREMAYRYQEDIMKETLAALLSFRGRISARAPQAKGEAEEAQEEAEGQA